VLDIIVELIRKDTLRKKSSTTSGPLVEKQSVLRVLQTRGYCHAFSKLLFLLMYNRKTRWRWAPCNVPSNFFLQMRVPAAALSRKFLHDLTTAWHFKSFFVICIMRIFTTKHEKVQLRGNNSVCAGAFRCLLVRSGGSETHTLRTTVARVAKSNLAAFDTPTGLCAPSPYKGRLSVGI
jgi:hypothetical protein